MRRRALRRRALGCALWLGGCGGAAPLGLGVAVDKDPRLTLEPVVGGVGWASPDPQPVTALSWADLDGDGALDLGIGGGGQRYLDVYEWSDYAELTTNVLVADGREFGLVFRSDPPCMSWSHAWADVDGDGDPDLLLGNATGAELNGAYFTVVEFPLTLYRNDGGSLVQSWSAAASDWRDTTSVAWADVDGDGDPDLAQGARDGLVLWRNAGDGQLEPEVLHRTLYVHDVAWVDREGDGFPELTIGTEDGLWILDNGDGTPTFGEAPALRPGEDVRKVVWGDWVGDGRQHPVIATATDVQAYAVAGSSFALRLTEARDEDEPYALALADFDVDGRLDVAIGWSRGAVEVLTGLDSFTGRVLVAGWEEGDGLDPVQAFAVGDWDGDGDPDLAVGRGDGRPSYAETRVSGVYESLGAGAGEQPQGVALDCVALAAGDWDGDGRRDLACSYLVADAANEHGALGVALNGAEGLTAPATGAIFELPEGEAAGDSSTIHAVAWADWDADGDLDLGLATSLGPMLLENRDGQVVPAWFDPASEPAGDVAFADFDADGDLDFAVGGESLRLFRHDGARWELATSLVDTPASSLAWAHLDGDGRLALAFTDGVSLRILESGGLADAPWVERALSDAPEGVGVVVAADVDADGDDELFLTGWDRTGDRIVDVHGSAVAVVWTGVLASAADYNSTALVASGPTVAVADVDEDGVVDFETELAVYQHRDGAWVPTQRLEEGLGRAGPAAWFDLDRDGRVDRLVAGTDVTESEWVASMNARGGLDQLPFNPPRLYLAWGDGVPAGPAHAMGAPLRLDQPTVAVELTVADAELDAVSGLRFEFRDWQGGWRPATVEGLSGSFATAPFSEGGQTYTGTWRWADDGADGEDVSLRVVLDRPTSTGGELRTGRVATSVGGLRVYLDSDGDGLRESSDPCPGDPTNDSLVPGVCDSVTVQEGWWCASAGASRGRGALGAVLAALAVASVRRRPPADRRV